MLKKRTKAVLAKIFTIAILTTFSGVAFASASNANVNETEVIEDITEAVETSAIIHEEIPESSAFTPEGNMTIVDDIGNSGKAGKQFLTVTTENGNYFYIVIDRDDHGEKSVHFLSMVDEEDLLAALGPESAKKYKKQMEESNSNASVSPLTIPPLETQAQPETQPKVNENSGKLSMISTIIIVILMGGAGAFYWFTKKRNASNDEDLYDQDEDFDSDEYEG